jgi:hypothetical protein
MSSTLDLSQLHSPIAVSFAQGTRTNTVVPETAWSYINSPPLQVLHLQQYPQRRVQAQHPRALSHRRAPVRLPRKLGGYIGGVMLMASTAATCPTKQPTTKRIPKMYASLLAPVSVTPLQAWNTESSAFAVMPSTMEPHFQPTRPIVTWPVQVMRRRCVERGIDSLFSPSEHHRSTSHLPFRPPVYLLTGYTKDVFSQYIEFPVDSELTLSTRDNTVSAEDAGVDISTFPYMAFNNASNDATTCITLCQQFGYNAAGLEYGSQCCKNSTISRFSQS